MKKVKTRICAGLFCSFKTVHSFYCHDNGGDASYAFHYSSCDDVGGFFFSPYVFDDAKIDCCHTCDHYRGADTFHRMFCCDLFARSACLAVLFAVRWHWLKNQS
jgi:hypothetical protein